MVITIICYTSDFKRALNFSKSDICNLKMENRNLYFRNRYSFDIIYNLLVTLQDRFRTHILVTDNVGYLCTVSTVIFFTYPEKTLIRLTWSKPLLILNGVKCKINVPRYLIKLLIRLHSRDRRRQP